MVKSTKEQKKARREERTWNTWLWGAKGNAVWDESGRRALRIDQAFRQNARAAAAEVSQVESEQFAWQAGRWGHQPSAAQGDGELLKAALLSLGSCTLKEIQERERSSTSESDSKSQSSEDESEARASTKAGSTSGISGGKHDIIGISSASRDIHESRKCGCRRGLADGIAQDSLRRSASQCKCKLTSYTSDQEEHQEDKRDFLKVLTTRTSWPMYSFGAERSIHCSCLWNSEKAGESVEDARRKRLGNLSPVDRVSDDVLLVPSSLP